MTDAVGSSALSKGMASCHTCLKLSPIELHHCPRCGSTMHARETDSLQRCVALLITACILYIPANIFPIMVTEQLGASINSTIIGGVVLLVQHGSLPIALVIFIASVIVPMAKLFALFYLAWSVERRPDYGHRQRTRLFLAAEFIGKWSMVDVFVVAILVALIHLSGLLVIKPGIATYSFAGVVLVTMFAAESFDPRLMWDRLEEKNDGSTTGN